MTLRFLMSWVERFREEGETEVGFIINGTGCWIRKEENIIYCIECDIFSLVLITTNCNP